VPRAIVSAARQRNLSIPQALASIPLPGAACAPPWMAALPMFCTDVVMESAGVVLAGNDPRAVLSMVDLARVWQNLIWATGYNVLAVPLAAAVLVFAGVVLSPAAAAVLMSVSTIVVALNAQRCAG
jgi:cation transport ATPase